jgi:hypothetical protein
MSHIPHTNPSTQLAKNAMAFNILSDGIPIGKPTSTITSKPY